MVKIFWVYILECSNNSFYTGYTVDIVKRYQAHCDGTANCKYTRQFRPVQLLQCWQVDNKSLAMKVEWHIKQLSRKEKIYLIENPNYLTTFFPVTVCADKLVLKNQNTRSDENGSKS